MSNVINKSNHPVEIKKISLSLWSLRDEIEAAIAERLAEPKQTEVDIEDIKSYYISTLNQQANDLAEEKEDVDENVAELVDDLDEGEEKSEDAIDEEADIEKLAEEMLADKSLDDEEEDDDVVETPRAPRKPFERINPPHDKQITAFLMLSDINMGEILIFSQGGLIQGQNMVIKFNIPNSFKLLATVVKCQNISRRSKIISSAKPSHRIFAKFEFKFPGERESLRNFLMSIEPTIPASPKKLKKPVSDEDDDDDFGDLGF